MKLSASYKRVQDRRYALWGQDTTLKNPKSGASMTLRLIDATKGIEVGDGMVTLSTVEPAAMVRKAELTSNDIRASDLINSEFTLNDAAWRVESTQPRPTVHGAEYGEVVLLLARACD